MAKGLKVKVIEFWRPIPMFVEVAGEKQPGGGWRGGFLSPDPE